MLKDLGMAEPQSVMEPQARASFEAIGSNSPVAVESNGRIGQSASETGAPFFEAFVDWPDLESPDSLQAARANARATAIGRASKLRRENVFMMDKIETQGIIHSIKYCKKNLLRIFFTITTLNKCC